MSLLPFGSAPGKGSGGGGASSVVNTGTADGTATGTAPLFYNTASQSLKVYVGGYWVTLATVSFDSLWNSVTDDWNSVSMDWNSPI